MAVPPGSAQETMSMTGASRARPGDSLNNEPRRLGRATARTITMTDFGRAQAVRRCGLGTSLTRLGIPRTTVGQDCGCWWYHDDRPSDAVVKAMEAHRGVAGVQEEGCHGGVLCDLGTGPDASWDMRERIRRANADV